MCSMFLCISEVDIFVMEIGKMFQNANRNDHIETFPEGSQISTSSIHRLCQNTDCSQTSTTLVNAGVKGQHVLIISLKNVISNQKFLSLRILKREFLSFNAKQASNIQLILIIGNIKL